jgi:hypothetical protein
LVSPGSISYSNLIHCPLQAQLKQYKKFPNFLSSLLRGDRGRSFTNAKTCLLWKMVSNSFFHLYLPIVNTSVNFCGSFWSKQKKINIFMSNESSKLIMLVDLMEDRQAKLEELQYYEQCLQDLLRKMSMIKGEIDLTNNIIGVIKNEKADVIAKFITSQDNKRTLKFK